MDSPKSQHDQQSSQLAGGDLDYPVGSDALSKAICRLWTDDNAIVIRILAIVLLICCLVGLAGRTVPISSESVVQRGVRVGVGAGDMPVISELIDPDLADWPSLGRLPGIGPVRAKAICNYRQKLRNEGRKGRIFTCPDDLQAVYGIGPETARRASVWLSFPVTEASTEEGAAQ